MLDEINGLIEQLTGEIAVRQDALTALHKLKNGTAAPVKTPAIEMPIRASKPGPKKRGPYKKRGGFQPLDVASQRGPTKAKAGSGAHGVTRPTTETGGATSVAVPRSTEDILNEKPDTIPGAMKWVIRQAPKGPFDGPGIEAALNKEFAKLMASEPTARKKIDANLAYWAKSEKIAPNGDGFKVVDGEFFGVEA